MLEHGCRPPIPLDPPMTYIPDIVSKEFLSVQHAICLLMADADQHLLTEALHGMSA